MLSRTDRQRTPKAQKFFGSFFQKRTVFPACMTTLLRTLPATTPEMLAIFDDAALLRAALAFEATLARVCAESGLIPATHADRIEACCTLDGIDVTVLATDAAHAGTLAIPLVAVLRARVGQAAAAAVHRGATSQDLADTALMLQAKQGVALLLRDLHRLSADLAILAQAYAATPMLGRTLLQGALPITFGLKLAGWLSGIDAATDRLKHEAAASLALQFGGAAGTRAGLDGKGAEIARRMAHRLGLHNPVLPWHAQRDRLAGLGVALAILCGALGKIATDLALLAQGEVAEAFEPVTQGRGGSSAMAHKRNPTGCQVARSAALRAPGLAATLLATLPGEHERSLGAWQAEAPVLADLFLLTHGALAAMLPVIASLEVDTNAMQRNLNAADHGSGCGEAAALVHAMLAARTGDQS
jgi:3-carboxy-cis,cis-muconate cycloisomerase